MIYEKEKIAARIKERRTELRLTQNEITEKTGINPSTLIALEKGKAMPRFETLLMLCEPLQCEVGYLLGEYDAPTRTIAAAQSMLELSDKTIEKLCLNYEDRLCFFDYFVENGDLITDHIFNLNNLYELKKLFEEDEYHKEILRAFKESGAYDVKRKAGLYYSTKEERRAEHLFKEKLTEILKEKLNSDAANVAEWKSSQYFKILFNDGFSALRATLQCDFMQLVDNYIKETSKNPK